VQLLQEFFEIGMVGLALPVVAQRLDGFVANPVCQQRPQNQADGAPNCCP